MDNPQNKKNKLWCTGHRSKVYKYSHWKNKKLSEEHKKNIGLSGKGHKGMLGKENPRYNKPGTFLNHHHTEETRKNIGFKSKGNKYSFKGGIVSIVQRIKNSPRYKQWRQDCFIRDNFTCQKCGQIRGGKLNVHHIKHFIVLLNEAKEYMPLLDLYSAAMLYSPLWDIINGITLCYKCHKQEHKRIK